MFRTKKLKLLNILIILVLCNCSTNPPEIKDSFVQINIFNDRENNLIYQKMSVFITPFDGDGFEDLNVFYIINDSDELFWAVTSEEWLTGNKNGNKWIGTNSLVMSELDNFPKGEYRIILEDLSGDSVERSVYITYMETDKYNFPYTFTDENNLYIQGTENNITLWVYENDSFKNSMEMIDESIDKKLIFPEAAEFNFSYFIYYFDQELNTGIIYGPHFDN